ncbi:MAG: T9SS type A sorting domain-containing protein [Flavobacteriales bacterium]|nr:T9SS type A sorting domain-containing protein [Flavobacteriales bacterium]
MRSTLFLFVLLPIGSLAQSLSPVLLTTLPSPLDETSALMRVEGELWTILDSGNPPALYAIDPGTGAVTRTLQLTGVTNVDFEALTTDGLWVYVGDFGNNSGSRTNLRIHRFPLSVLLDPDATEAAVETIGFSYSDQTEFTPAFDATNFDCEAMVAVDDSLFLFTKRWLDGQTRLYALPAEPGTHVAQARGSFNVQGLITDAALDAEGGLVLLGHIAASFVWRFSGFPGHAFFDGGAERLETNLMLHQTEGIAWTGPGEVWITNETGFGNQSSLWRLDLDMTVGERVERLPGFAIWPQPASESIRFNGLRAGALVRVLDSRGAQVLHQRIPGNTAIDVSRLPAGRYEVLVEDGQSMQRLPLIIAR